MPKPTETLMHGAAQAIYDQLRDFWDQTNALGTDRKKEKTPLLRWEQLDAEHQERWINAAKAAYAVIALAGGAKQIPVEIIRPGSKSDH